MNRGLESVRTDDTAARGPRGASRLLVLLFLVFTIGGYFWNLGTGSLATWDESLTAERAREMALTGDWITPHIQLRPDFAKPPLYYALTAAFFKAFGEDEFTVRLGSVLFGLGVVGLVFLLGTGASGHRRAGLLAALLLATNPHWMNMTRQGLLDSGLLFGMLGGIYLLLLRPPTMTNALLAGASLAVGSLIKNPLAVAALLVPALELAVHRREPRRRKMLLVALAAFAVLGLGWYVLQIALWGREYLNAFFGYNVYQRLTTPIEGHRATWTYYVVNGWRLAPGSLLFFAAPLLPALLYQRKAVRSCAAYILFALALLGTLTISATKRDTYLLLIYPFAAIASGVLLEAWLVEIRSRWRAVLGHFILIVVLLIPFVRAYEPHPDYQPAIKKIGKALRGSPHPAATALLPEVHVAALMFYSHRNAFYAGDRPLAETLADLGPAAKGDLCLVVPRKAMPRWRGQAETLTTHTVADVAAETENYVALRLRPRDTGTD